MSTTEAREAIAKLMMGFAGAPVASDLVGAFRDGHRTDHLMLVPPLQAADTDGEPGR